MQQNPVNQDCNSANIPVYLQADFIDHYQLPFIHQHYGYNSA